MNQKQTLPATPDPIDLAWASLSPKQIAFVQEYERCGSKVQAYRHAYDWNGSNNAARVNAVRVAQSANVAIILGDAVATIRDSAREASLGAAERLLAAATVPEDATAARMAVAIQAERLLSDQAQVTGQGASVQVNIQNNAVDPSQLWGAGGSDAWGMRHETSIPAASVTLKDDAAGRPA